MKMKIYFLPKSKLGKWSIGLIISLFILVGIFFLFIKLGERGGATYWANLKLAIPGTLAAISGILSFITGVIGIIKDKERAVLVYVTTIVGFLILLWVLAEVAFPH